MSRGYGRIERAILDRLTEEPDNAFTVEDLAEWIYDEEWVDKKHRVAILRASRSLRRSNKNIGLYNDWTPKIVVYNLGSGKSYAMARQKNDELAALMHGQEGCSVFAMEFGWRGLSGDVECCRRR